MHTPLQHLQLTSNCNAIYYYVLLSIVILLLNLKTKMHSKNKQERIDS